MALPRLRHSEKFRTYQRQAIEMVRRYRNNYSGSPSVEHPASGAALVCHPTGTGKTVVIAGLAHAAPEIGNVLVLTTREAVRDQLSRELAGDLFIDTSKFGLGINIRLAKVVYVVEEGRALLGEVGDLHASSCKLYGVDLRAFSERQFDRLVDRPKQRFLDELATGRSIILMTVQMLVGLERENHAAFAALCKRVDLVLFDEGHYEPAVKYSAAVRSLNRPVALMSATPFRNDLKPFQVHKQNIHILKFADAVDGGYIREVEVVRRAPTRDTNVFSEDVIDFCEKEFGHDRSTWPRIIVHCENMSAIVRLSEAFISKGFDRNVVAIHDRFAKKPDGSGWQHHTVPPPRSTDALIWIHQYKLMEGIDDHRFRVLAFFDPLQNVRSVVQQIGRVIRKTPGASKSRAYVLDHYHGRVHQYWSMYKAYDSSMSAEFLTKTLSKFYLDKYIEIHPEFDYLDRKFRGRLDLHALKSAGDEILFERRATFRKLDKTATLESIAALIEESFKLDDFEFAKHELSETVVLYICAKVYNPEFLNSLFFAEPRHGARVVVMLPRHGAVALSSVGSAAPTDGLGDFDKLLPLPLERLLDPGEVGRFSSVSSQNTNLGNRVVRRRTISAPSIAAIPPILDEYGHVVSVVTGYNGTALRIVDDIDYQEFVDEEMNIVASSSPPADNRSVSQPDLIRRYVGIASGRVSEQGPPLRVNKFCAWVESLAEQMESGSRHEEVYERYAAIADKPVSNGAAKNLLLDLMDLADRYVHKDTGLAPGGDDLCVDRVGSAVATGDKIVSKFHVVLNENAYEIDVTYNRASQRYRLDSLSLDIDFIRSGGPKTPLCRAINDRQSFNIIPDDLNVIYVHGRFYAPALKFGPRFSKSEFFAGHCLYPAETFKRISSEKGDRVVAKNGYDPNSLFGLIDGWKSGFDTDALKLSKAWTSKYRLERIRFTPTHCVCDDIGSETADFIFADIDKRRVILVHAKASSTFREYSASAVQEVCAQAQKNTSLFSTFSLQPPPNLKLWNGPHKFIGKGEVRLSVMKRIRKPEEAKAASVWADLLEVLHNPLTEREIWLVLGNMLSAEKFYSGLESEEPAPETLQLNHLLQTTIAAAGSVGAKTRIFCAP